MPGREGELAEGVGASGESPGPGWSWIGKSCRVLEVREATEERGWREDLGGETSGPQGTLRGDPAPGSIREPAAPGSPHPFSPAPAGPEPPLAPPTAPPLADLSRRPGPGPPGGRARGRRAPGEPLPRAPPSRRTSFPRRAGTRRAAQVAPARPASPAPAPRRPDPAGWIPAAARPAACPRPQLPDNGAGAGAGGWEGASAAHGQPLRPAGS